MSKEFGSPSFRTRPDTKPSHMLRPETRADQLQQEVRSRLERMSQEQRADLAGAAHEHALIEGLYLSTPLPDGTGEQPTPIPFYPVPRFLDAKEMNAHAKDVSLVYGALLRIEHMALAEETELGKEVLQKVIQGMTPEEGELTLRARSRHDSTARRRNARADTFINHMTGEIQMIEINNTNPEGMRYHHALLDSAVEFTAALGIHAPSIDQRQTSAEHQVLDMLIDEYADRADGEMPKRIGFVYDQQGDESIVNRSELPNVGERFKAYSGNKIDIVHGDPMEVEADNGKMAVKGEEVDVIWRNAMDVPKAMHNAPGMTEVMSHPDKYVILNDPSSAIIGSKVMLGYLHDERIQNAIGMTAEERAAVLRAVPFTFTPGEDVYLKVDGKMMHSTEYLRKFQKEFVLKPGTGTHGEQLHFGVNTNNGWNHAVDEAVSTGTFVAQRYVDYRTSTEQVVNITPDGALEEIACVRDVNIHHIDGEAIGTSISRVVPPENVITTMNVANGGGLQATPRA